MARRRHKYNYSYFRRLDGTRRASRRRRILPLPENQGAIGSCYAHASVNCLESRIRLRQPCPRLSIQHCINHLMTPGHGHVGLTAGAVFSFLIEHGVTVESQYPFTGGVHANYFHEGNCYTFAASGASPPYDVQSKALLLRLMDNLKTGGPFVARFPVRESYDGDTKIFRAVGKYRLRLDGYILFHANLITGYKLYWDRSIGRWRGYWRFLDSLGTDWLKNGFGKVDVEVMLEVLVPIVDFGRCPWYQRDY